MRKVRKFFKKYGRWIILAIIVAVLVAGLFAVKNFFFPNESGVLYGNRLDGRDKVKIKEDTKKQIKDTLGERSSSVKVRIAGRIIYIDVVVNDDVSKEDARGLGDKVLEFFSDQEKSYYDIQILINNKANAEQFPIIGYKHHTRESLTWTKDR